MSASDKTGSQAVTYRILIVREDDSIESARTLIAVDDDQAIAAARAMTNEISVELWEGFRYIDRFDKGGDIHDGLGRGGPKRDNTALLAYGAVRGGSVD